MFQVLHEKAFEAYVKEENEPNLPSPLQDQDTLYIPLTKERVI